MVKNIPGKLKETLDFTTAALHATALPLEH